MNVPSDDLQPITAEQLRKIIEGLESRCKVPPVDELAVLAAALTGLQYCNLPPDQEWDRDFPTRVTDVTSRRDTVRKTSPRLRPTFDIDERTRDDGTTIGHPRHDEKDWRDLAPDIAARFRRVYPGQEFGDRGGPVARFAAAVIPLIFPGQNPDADTVGQYLARHRRKQETRARR